MVSIEDLTHTIAVAHNKMIQHLINAGEADNAGDWRCALKHAEKAEWQYSIIKIVSTTCSSATEEDIKPYVNENVTIAKFCDVTKNRGIGKWAIRVPVYGAETGCTVFQIRGSNVPPPYGEFNELEFQTNEFTQIII